MAEIAVRENEFDLAARIGFRALSLCKEGTERERILGDIAHAFARMRAFDAARDAYLAIASRSREQWVRWAAYINLLDIEASVRDRRAFDRYDKILSRSKLTPELAVWYRLTVGEGLLLFDEPVAARDHLQRALAMAVEFGFNEAVIATEDCFLPLPVPGRRLNQNLRCSQTSSTKLPPLSGDCERQLR